MKIQKDIQQKIIYDYDIKKFKRLEIAKKYKVALKTIDKILKLNNITIRRRGSKSGILDENHTSLFYILENDKNKIIKCYMDGLTSVEIGKLYNCKATHIVNFLSRNKIKLHGPNEVRLQKIQNILYANKDEIIDLYINKKEKLKAIQEKFKISGNALKKFITKEGIKIRSLSESRKLYKVGFFKTFEKLTIEQKQEYFWNNIKNKTQSKAYKTYIILKELFPTSFIELEHIITFNDKKMRGDFYFEIDGKKIMVEYNGIQHYKVVKFPQMNAQQAQDKFDKQQIRDQALKDYCKQENIVLLEIDCRIARKKGLRETILDLLSTI